MALSLAQKQALLINRYEIVHQLMPGYGPHNPESGWDQQEFVETMETTLTGVCWRHPESGKLYHENVPEELAELLKFATDLGA